MAAIDEPLRRVAGALPLNRINGDHETTRGSCRFVSLHTRPTRPTRSPQTSTVSAGSSGDTRVVLVSTQPSMIQNAHPTRGLGRLRDDSGIARAASQQAPLTVSGHDRRVVTWGGLQRASISPEPGPTRALDKARASGTRCAETWRQEAMPIGITRPTRQQKHPNTPPFDCDTGGGGEHRQRYVSAQDMPRHTTPVRSKP